MDRIVRVGYLISMSENFLGEEMQVYFKRNGERKGRQLISSNWGRTRFPRSLEQRSVSIRKDLCNFVTSTGKESCLTPAQSEANLIASSEHVQMPITTNLSKIHGVLRHRICASAAEKKKLRQTCTFVHRPLGSRPSIKKMQSIKRDCRSRRSRRSV